MRVLHFYRTYFPDSFGGVERVIYQLCESTQSQGVESQVLTLSRTGSSTIKVGNHVVHRAKLDFEIASTGFSWSSIARLAELAKSVDVVHYHFPWPFMDFAHFLAGIKKPTVVTYHSDIIRQKRLLMLYRPLMHRFLSRVDRIVATSPNYLATSDLLSAYRHKADAIPIGLNKQSYPTPSPDRIAHWKARFGERFFLFVGVLRYYKGLHILLDAVSGTDYPVVIVGAGPTEASLKKHARDLNLRNVHFLGELPEEDKVALLQLSYAIVFPSHLRSEAFGISLLEGAMYGKPMISSEIGTGTSFVNINEETGIVVPPGDPAAFREAMRFLWDNPTVAAEMGARAERRYRDLFTADRMAQGYTQLYVAIARPGSAAPGIQQRCTKPSYSPPLQP